MTNITINGKNFEGNHLKVSNKEAQIDGEKVDVDIKSTIDVSMNSNEGTSSEIEVGKQERITIHQETKKGDNYLKISFWKDAAL